MTDESVSNGPKGATSGTFRIVVFGTHLPSAEALCGAVAAIAPSAEVDTGDLAMTLDAPEGSLFVIDATRDAARATELLRVIRARGAPAPVILVSDRETGIPAEALQQAGDAALVTQARLSEALPREMDRAAAAVARAAASPTFAALAASVRETRRLIAAGMIARRVKHDINNPLAALMAEAQLLELDPLSDEQRASVQRIVELCRRVTSVARQLEGPAPPAAGAETGAGA